MGRRSGFRMTVHKGQCRFFVATDQYSEALGRSAPGQALGSVHGLPGVPKPA